MSRRTWAACFVALLVLLTGACSSDDERSGAPTVSADAVADDRTTTTGDPDPGTDGSAGDGDAVEREGDADGGGNGGHADGNPAGGNGDGSDSGDGAGQVAGPDDASRVALTPEEICRLLPAQEVAAALGVDSVTAAPGASETPQCSYAFTTDDGIQTDVTVAALRTEEDLDGLEGAAAFDRVVERNRAAAGSEVADTEVAVGDQALLLSTNSLHFGVVQLDWRIVTTIVSTEVADAAAAASLTRTVEVLAP